MDARNYLFTLPEKTRNTDIDPSIDASILFQLSGPEGGDYTVIIKDGNVEVEEKTVEDPNCIVKGTAENFAKVINKEISPVAALFTGKLKVNNQGELMKYAKLIGLMG